IGRARLQFGDGEELRCALDGVDTLYNTYWVRFVHGGTTFERAVANTRVLLDAARAAGVRRIVHVSVTQPSLESPLPYFRGKAEVEADVVASGLPHAIVRPTLVFGPRDILVNNIAWGLRRAPVFPLAGNGAYRVQPVSVEDVATICVDAAERSDDIVLDAAGPETLTYEELVRLVAAAVGARSRIVHWPRGAVLALARLIGSIRRDVLLTPDELAGLEAGLLVSGEPPLGTASFRSWVAANGEGLGRGYVSELARNFRPYDPL
ncbi:MAG: NmrA family NAD(P)-binding protein, partial [Actinomycetota bacterium]|nr:NmrA family NAD(P)-binding protein [Actinomycetota bacterium]